MLNNKQSYPLQWFEFVFDRHFIYTSEIYNLFKPIIDKADMIFFYSQKNSGKSVVGYNLMQQTIDKKENVIYGRLQAKEKDNAIGDIIADLALKGYDFQKIRGYGNTYYLNKDLASPTIKFVSMGDYQSMRSSINNNTGLIFFDEINTTLFPPNFLTNFLNSLSTMGRDKPIKFYGAGNNETAQNNPLLQLCQIALKWDSTYLQLAFRIVNGAIILVFQCGGSIFDTEKRPLNLSARLGMNLKEYNDKFLKGVNTDISAQQVLNVPEFITYNKHQFKFGIKDKCYLVSSIFVNDIINTPNQTIKGFYIEELSNQEEINKYHIPFYAFDLMSFNLYTKAKLMERNDVGTFMKPYAMAFKRKILWFKSFDTQQEILTHWAILTLLDGVVSNLEAI